VGSLNAPSPVGTRAPDDDDDDDDDDDQDDQDDDQDDDQEGRCKRGRTFPIPRRS